MTSGLANERVRNTRSDRSLLVAAAQQGYDYLTRSVWPRGIQSQVGIDADFSQSFPLNRLRALVRDHSNADIGFDAGDEAFSSMIALKLFGNDPAARTTIEVSRTIVRRQMYRGRYRFFCRENGFAADTDCTSVAAASLYEGGWLTDAELRASGEELLTAAAPTSMRASENLDETGKSGGELHARVAMVYWDDGVEPGAAPRGYKHDAAAAANTLYALMLARDAGLKDAHGITEATLAYVCSHLRDGAYLAGTRYYPAPDTFLHNASCLVRRFPDKLDTLADALRAAVAHRATTPATPGTADDPAGVLNVAQRLLAEYNLGAGTATGPAIQSLAKSQLADGSWPAAPYYSLGKRAFYFGSNAVTTMFVVKAIDEYLRRV